MFRCLLKRYDDLIIPGRPLGLNAKLKYLAREFDMSGWTTVLSNSKKRIYPHPD